MIPNTLRTNYGSEGHHEAFAAYNSLLLQRIIMSINNSNFINLIGRLGDTPESRTLPSGQTVTAFSLATNENYKDRSGNRVVRTEWHKVKAFGKAAEVLSQYLERGSKVAIVGTLRYSKWRDKFDQTRNTAEIIVQSFEFMDSRKGTPSSATGDSSTIAAEPMAKRTAAGRAQKSALADELAMPEPEEELPF